LTCASARPWPRRRSRPCSTSGAPRRASSGSKSKTSLGARATCYWKAQGCFAAGVRLFCEIVWGLVAGLPRGRRRCTSTTLQARTVPRAPSSASSRTPAPPASTKSTHSRRRRLRRRWRARLRRCRRTAWSARYFRRRPTAGSCGRSRCRPSASAPWPARPSCSTRFVRTGACLRGVEDRPFKVIHRLSPRAPPTPFSCNNSTTRH